MWHGVAGHEQVIERFRRGLASERLGGAYLFVGPSGIGKRTLAERISQALLCEASPAPLEICGSCQSCRLVQAGAHPDLDVVARPPEKSEIPLDLLIGDKDHRMREGLCHRIALKPFRGRRKVAIIDDADYLNQECANALLKTLEEPPPGSIIILIAASAARQLPTIRSRAQLVLCSPLSDEELAELIEERGLTPDRQSAQCLAAQSGGSMEVALRLAEPETGEFCTAWRRLLAAPALDPLALVHLLTEYVEAAGTQAADRRARLRLAAETAAEFYRQAMRKACGAEVVADVNVPDLDDRIAEEALWRCLQAIGQVERNANQGTLIAAWIDDLVRLSAGERLVAEALGYD